MYNRGTLVTINSFFSFVRRHRVLAATVLASAVFCLSAVAMAGITYQDSQTNGSTEVTYTSIAVNKPTNVVAGDLMLASIAINGGDMAVVSLIPSGWTLISSTTNDGKPSLLSYFKIAGGSEGSSYEWRVNGSRTGAGGITRYTGVDTTNPIDAHDNNGNVGLGITATTCLITTTVASGTIVTLFAVDEGKPSVGSYFDEVTGMTERYERKGTDVGPTIALDDAVQAAVGSVSSKTSAIGGSNKAKNWASQVIALRPAPVTPTVVTTGSKDNGLNASGSFSVNSGGATACFVGFGGYNDATVTSLTWGGNSMTEVARNGGSGSFHGDLWYIKNPPSGTSTLAYSYSASDNANFGWLCTVGEATSPIGAIATSSGGDTTSRSVSITTTAADSLIVAILHNNNNAGTMSVTGANATLAWSSQETSPDTETDSGLYQTTSGIARYTPGFSWTTEVGQKRMIAVEVLAQ